MSTPRYLWGKTKMDKIDVKNYIDLRPQTTDPSAASGRVFMDSFGMLRVCWDGSNFETVLKMEPRANPPQPYKGRVYMDPAYKLRVCEDGSTFTTVTTT